MMYGLISKVYRFSLSSTFKTVVFMLKSMYIFVVARHTLPLLAIVHSRVFHRPVLSSYSKQWHCHF